MTFKQLANNKCFRTQLNTERGMILFTVLLILSLLMAAGVGAVISVQNEFRITQNLKSGTSALYAAEAGIEWAKEQIGNAGTNPPTLIDSSQGFASGNFSLMVVSSNKISPLSGQIAFRSNGVLASASQTVQVQITKLYDLADGALALRGSSRSLNFGTNSLYISGQDYDPSTGRPDGEAKPRPGVTLGNLGLLQQLENALGSFQRSQIVGSDGTGAPISRSDRLPGDAVARLANELCASANAQTVSIPPSGNLSLSNQTWGDRTVPQLRCITGLSQSGDAVVTGANFGGAGILVVKDAELILADSLRWEGLIIVTGNDIGFRVTGEANKEIVGAVLVNETGPALGPGAPLLDIQGAIRILYSRFTLRIAANLFPTSILADTYVWLPFDLKQDYWRSVSQ